jgi:hypothetical protein
MTRARLNAVAALLPLVLSALAFALVITNYLAGVPPQQDEGTGAHIWQLMMLAQLPLILLFVITADWRRWSATLLFGAQILGIAIACLPVWLAGY